MTTRKAENALRFAVTGALAAVLLAGCAGAGKGPSTALNGSQMQSALAKGDVEGAIALAEAAVAASPREAGLRAMLAQAYLKAGRFESAATTFNDAMDLGDNSTRTALSLALSEIGAGRGRDAVAILEDWRGSIPAGDFGLALALAGESARGVAVLTDTIRGGDNTPKLRQNLAYAYALDGRWREARLIMSQDVPADQVDERLSEWALRAKPEDVQHRVAAMLGVPVRADSGQPTRLALNNAPSAEQLAAEAGVAASETAAEPQPQVAAATELPPIAEPAISAPAPEVALAKYEPVTTAVAVAEPAPLPEPVSAPAPIAAEPVSVAGVSLVSAPVAQAVPIMAVPTYDAGAPPRSARRARKPAVAAAPIRRTATAGTHLIQLGSFSSAQGARRAWGIFSARNPELRNYRMTITPVRVNGKDYWRVAAAGFDGRSASGLCSKVKGRGGSCFAYSGTSAFAQNVAQPRGVFGPRFARR